MIKQQLKDILQKLFPEEKIVIDYVPKEKQGDYSTNIAFRIAAQKKMQPYETAQEIASRIHDPMIKSISVHKPAFINFTISNSYMLEKVFSEPEEIDIGKGQKIMIEFVSANPTGPINIASARAAAVGDSLARLLKRTGYNVVSEYYVNDGGRQSTLLAESVRQRIRQLNGKTAEIPEGGYHGEYIIDLAKEVKEKGIEDIEKIKKYAIDYFTEGHKRILQEFGVEFNNWIRESSIYQKGYVDDVLSLLQEKNLTYVKDGAVWIRTTKFGDNEDRVIITSDNRHTYLLPDIAYHLDKMKRQHDRLINIWGPDHQAQIKSLQCGIIAIGYPRETLEILIVQQVHLKEAGKLIKMSKRAGVIKTLKELLKHVPKDVVRFFLLMRSNSQPLDFDLDLALEQSDENPVFYVQYAHARIKSIIRKAQEQGIEYDGSFAKNLLKETEEISLVKAILKFPEVIEDAARNFEPYMLTYYLIELARIFHSFYQRLRVINEDKELTQARLALISKTAETIKSGLEILAISCPERM
ncbi:MAG: arginine--tRNA ligase [bacterium]